MNTGLFEKSADLSGRRDVFITYIPPPETSPQDIVRNLQQVLDSRRAQTVKCDVFGPISLYSEFMENGQDLLLADGCPVLWVEGEHDKRPSILGVQVYGVSGPEVNTIRIKGRPLGRIFEDRSGKYCFLNGITPEPEAGDLESQTISVVNSISQGLGQAGLEMNDLVRTWFFNKHILSWYDDFNSFRTACYKDQGIFSRGWLPSSTGISGYNPQNKALQAGAAGVRPQSSGLSVNEIKSTVQPPAFDYGSAFSRAVVIREPQHAFITVSGTASIGKSGDTLFPGDFSAQVHHTLDAVRMLLNESELDFGDVSRCTAYVKRPEDLARLPALLKAHGLEKLPLVTLVTDICRDDLLFELEADAAAIYTS